MEFENNKIKKTEFTTVEIEIINKESCHMCFGLGRFQPGGHGWPVPCPLCNGVGYLLGKTYIK
ncbi:hypothetical protein M0R19_05985 [Candidatus Pacearchaeota archaeon]|jgi:DnaJ-class molecular chaperone|nr:hypothetical protein [Candidatus Pacearchaeota archaeon]